MKTTVLAGTDNTVFTAADLLNPMEYKLVGYATTIRDAWNIYNEDGSVKEDLGDVMPCMPVEAAASYDPDLIILTAQDEEEDKYLKMILYRTDFRGEVLSFHDMFHGFSAKTAVLRKLAWRLEALGVEGSAADLGTWYGDIAWQMNALMPERKLYLFDTFTGLDVRDVKTEEEGQYSDAKVGQYALTERELARGEDLLLGRMPYPEKVVIRAGWFPETAYDLLDEKYALVHMDTGLYAPTFSGVEYFFPRLSKGGVILLAHYEDGKQTGVRKAVQDLEEKYGAFLITPLADLEGTIVITKP